MSGTISNNDEHPSVKIGPVNVSRIDLAGALVKLNGLIHSGGRHYVNFCEANLFAHACDSREVAAALNGSTLTFADGMIILLLSRLLGRPIPQRVTGPSFMLAACESGVTEGYRHYFYGGQDGVAEEMSRRLCQRYPGMIVAGTYTPPFGAVSNEEDERARKAIEEANPDLVWVGLGGTKQLQWMAEHVHSMNVPVFLGVGAAFDFHSGNVPWAPRWVRKIGMEWAYRALTGGRRLFLRNLWCVPRSALIAAREVYRARLCARTRPQ